ncbi:MAG: hypothetical protein RSE61_07205 [Anaerovoracaceae bacterium]
MKTYERLTYSTVMFKTKHIDGTTSTGTGFFIYMCHNKTSGQAKLILVTNKHVIKHYDETTITFCTKDENGNPNDQQTFSETLKNASWIMHPDPNIDLCCFDMTNIIKGNTFLSQVSKQRENTANIPEVHYHAISMDMTPSTDEIMT